MRLVRKRAVVIINLPVEHTEQMPNGCVDIDCPANGLLPPVIRAVLLRPMPHGFRKMNQRDGGNVA